jgi:O-antigen/teichoic acid export membrane protein
MDLIRKICRLGMGDVAGRICSVAIVVLIGHRFGVVVVGVYALAQALTQYMQPVIDFGLRHVGARLMAVYPEAGRLIVVRVQRRRWGMALAVVPFVILYAVSCKLAPEMKVFLLVFALTGTLYAASLDWAAWGKDDLYMAGMAKAIVPLCTVLFLFCGWGAGREACLWWIATGNALGYGIQVAVFRIWWRRRSPERKSGDLSSILTGHLEWRRNSIMGIALLCNLAFNMIDVLMLGAMSTSDQVGLYSAAYRVLNQILATYYLLTQAMYPQLARMENQDRTRMLKWNRLLSLTIGGLLLALAIVPFRKSILTILFGQPFAAGGFLLCILLFSIPCDFLTSYLSNAYIAWGSARAVLMCTACASGANIVLNALTIGRYGAQAAAVNTLVSYVVFVAMLLLVRRLAMLKVNDRNRLNALAHP